MIAQLLDEIKHQNNVLESLERNVSQLSERMNELENFAATQRLDPPLCSQLPIESRASSNHTTSPKVIINPASSFIMPRTPTEQFCRSSSQWGGVRAIDQPSKNLYMSLVGGVGPVPVDTCAPPPLSRAFSTRNMASLAMRKRGSDFSVEGAPNPVPPETRAEGFAAAMQHLRHLHGRMQQRMAVWLDYTFGIRPYDARLGIQGSKLVQPSSRFNSGGDPCPTSEMA